MPSWLVTLLVAVVVGGIVGGAVWLKRRSAESSTPAASESAPADGAATVTGQHRLARHVEVAGFRLSEDTKKRALVKMVVINHSAAELDNLTMTVTLKTPQGKVVGTADVKANVGPLGTVDVSAPLRTEERAYELPDWQFIRAEFQITSP